MTSAAHTPHFTPTTLLGTLTSNRAASVVAVIAGAIILLVARFEPGGLMHLAGRLRRGRRHG